MKTEQEKYEEHIQWLQSEQNFQAAIYYGLVAWIICAFLWLLISIYTWYSIWYMAIAVWFAVAYTIKFIWKWIREKI